MLVQNGLVFSDNAQVRRGLVDFLKSSAGICEEITHRQRGVALSIL